MTKINGTIAHVYWLKDLILLWQHSSKWSTDSIQSLANPSCCCFWRNWQSESKIHIKMQRTPNRQKKSQKKNKVGGLILSNFKTYYKTTVINTVWCWHKYKHIAKWNRIEIPEIILYIYSQLSSIKMPRQFNRFKMIFFPTNGAGTTSYPHVKEWS